MKTAIRVYTAGNPSYTRLSWDDVVVHERWETYTIFTTKDKERITLHHGSAVVMIVEVPFP